MAGHPAAARRHERPVVVALSPQRPDDRHHAGDEAAAVRLAQQLLGTVEGGVPAGHIAGHVAGRHEPGHRQSQDVGLVAADVGDAPHRRMLRRARRRAHGLDVSLREGCRRSCAGRMVSAAAVSRSGARDQGPSEKIRAVPNCYAEAWPFRRIAQRSCRRLPLRPKTAASGSRYSRRRHPLMAAARLAISRSCRGVPPGGVLPCAGSLSPRCSKFSGCGMSRRSEASPSG